MLYFIYLLLAHQAVTATIFHLTGFCLLIFYALFTYLFLAIVAT